MSLMGEGLNWGVGSSDKTLKVRDLDESQRRSLGSITLTHKVDEARPAEQTE